MKRLEYVGLKHDGERAFKERTGIEWFPGDKKDVADDVATEMLKHTDVWREVPPKAAALASAPAAAVVAAPAPQAPGADSGTDQGAGAQLPEWAKKGIELGASDEQLEAIAQAGGPGSEQGAALWRDATGTDWKPEAEAGASKSQVKRVKAQKTPAKKATAKKAARKSAKKAE